MAISLKPAQGTVVTVAVAGTPVAPGVALPDNCHTLIVYNPSLAATIYVQFVPNAGAFSTAAAVRVPPQASVTLAIGPLSQRPVTGAGAVLDSLFFDASANASTANVTYINGITS